MANNVIGQTGRSRNLLSDDAAIRKVSQKRTVRYKYQRVQSGWIAWVCGPFHSRTYGVCGFGARKAQAKVALQRRLADDYGHIGRLMFSDIDDADNVRLIGLRVRSDYPVEPITIGGADE